MKNHHYDSSRLIDYILITVLATIPIWRLSVGGIVSPIDVEFSTYPLDTFRSYLYSWLGNNNGYFNIVSNLNLIPYGFSALLAKLGVPIWIINRLWYVLPLTLLGGSTYFFSRVFVPGKGSRYIALVASFLSLYSYNVAMNLSLGWSMKAILPFSFNLLFISFAILGIKHNYDNKYILYAGFSSLFAFLLPPYSVLSFVLLFVFLVFYLSFNKADKKNIRKSMNYLFFLFLMVLLMNSWWLLTFIISGVLRGGLQYYRVDTFESVKYIAQFNNMLRTMLTRNNIPAIPLNEFQLSTQGYVWSILLTVIAFSSLLLKKYKNEVIYLSAVAVILLLLAVGGAPPFNFLYLFLFKHVPFFNIFREPSKFNAYITLAYSLLAGVVVVSIVKKIQDNLALKRYGNIVRNAITVTIVGFVVSLGIMNSYPLITGNMGGGMKAYSVPEYYGKAHDYIGSADAQSSVLVLPMPPLFSNFVWHKDENHIVNVARSVIPAPTVYDEFQWINLNKLQKETWYQLSSQDALFSGKVTRLLRIQNIRYVLMQNDHLYDKSMSQFERNIFLSTLSTNLSSQQGVRLERTFGKLDLYKISDDYFLPHIYASTYY